jgi:glyoxylase-like metal-dependent hydrolase (beta-lactamase superfamily II)
MADHRYRFHVGDFECIVIQDRIQTMHARQIFQNVPDHELLPALAAHDIDPEEVELSFNCLAVNTGDEWVLIDTGRGDAMETIETHLLDVLEDEEIRPSHIFLTHAHADHFAGLVNRKGIRNFPSAMVYMCRDEWAVCTSPQALEQNPQRAAMIRDYLLPAEIQIEQIECKGEILPGFSVIQLPGHTPHHIGVIVESNGERLIVPGDAIIHPLFFEYPEWQMAYDNDHATASTSRRKLAKLAVMSQALVLPYHFPFPGVGRVQRDGESYQWIPVK